MATIFQPQSSTSYWRELLELSAPFITVSNEICPVIAQFPNMTSDAIQHGFFQKLSDLTGQIQQLKATWAQEITDTTLKDRANEILGLKDVLNNFSATGSIGILDNIITNSAVTKTKVFAYLQDPQTPLEYFHCYASLLCLLQPLRIATLFLYRRSLADIHDDLVSELNDLSNVLQKGIDVAETIGRNRVTMSRKLVLFDPENPPVWSTEFRVMVDGVGIYLGIFVPPPYAVPPRSLGEIEEHAEQKLNSTKSEKAAEASANIRKLYANIQNLVNILH